MKNTKLLFLKPRHDYRPGDRLQATDSTTALPTDLTTYWYYGLDNTLDYRLDYILYYILYYGLNNTLEYT